MDATTLTTPTADQIKAFVADRLAAYNEVKGLAYYRDLIKFIISIKTDEVTFPFKRDTYAELNGFLQTLPVIPCEQYSFSAILARLQEEANPHYLMAPYVAVLLDELTNEEVYQNELLRSVIIRMITLYYYPHIQRYLLKGDAVDLMMFDYTRKNPKKG